MAEQVFRVREDTPHEDMRRLVRGRHPFRNLRGTYRGIRLTKLDVARLAEHPDVRALLTAESLLAFYLDEPDYVVWSGKAPLAWHSTTRGNERHRGKDRSAWEWVRAELRIWPDKVTEKRYNRMVGIVNELNSAQG